MPQPPVQISPRAFQAHQPPTTRSSAKSQAFCNVLDQALREFRCALLRGFSLHVETVDDYAAPSEYLEDSSRFLQPPQPRMPSKLSVDRRLATDSGDANRDSGLSIGFVETGKVSTKAVASYGQRPSTPVGLDGFQPVESIDQDLRGFSTFSSDSASHGHGEICTPARSVRSVVPSDIMARWCVLVEAVAFSENVTASEVHKCWDWGRPTNLGQVLGLNSLDVDESRRWSGKSHLHQHPSHTLPHTMLQLGTAATNKFARMFSNIHGGRQNYGWCLHPRSTKRLCWDIVGLLVCFYDLVTFPLQMVSLMEDEVAISLSLTIYWTLDIVMSCISGFFTHDGLIELRVAKVVQRYTRTWMLIDVSLCVFDWCSSFIKMSDAQILRLIKSALRFLRVVRLLRLVKLMPKLRKQFGSLNSDFISTWFRLALYICAVVMMNHYIACLWCFVWSQLNNPDDVYRYVSALHWALSHCLLGSMDLTPDTVEERILSCGVLVISMVVFATICSNITQDTACLQSLSADKQRREAVVRKFFSENKLPSDLVCRVWHVINQNNLAQGGRLQEDTVEMFNMLPQYLQKEIRYATFRPVLVNHPFFAFYEAVEPKAIRMLCTSGIQQMRILPYEQLGWPSDAGVNLMLFVVKGLLYYYPHDIDNFKVTCAEGQWALEETLWAKHAILDGILTSDSEPCELLLVLPHDFHDIARIHVRSMRHLRVYAREFVKRFNQECLNFDESDLLFNSTGVINDILSEVKYQCEVRMALLPSIHGPGSQTWLDGFSIAATRVAERPQGRRTASVRHVDSDEIFQSS